MHYQTIMYFARLSAIKDDRLLHEAYNWEKEKMQTGGNRIGMTNMW